ncbi:MAG: uroporphyrinogen-III C-methyltransferase [Rhizobacter sp.]|nr:uroporphyrinogen-III C-methyltransferase [Rhizobacter sp.]
MLALLGALSVVSLLMVWRTDQRSASLEQELVRRQQDSAGQSTEARMLAKQAQQGAGETAAKVALLEARLAEVTVQRSQFEELIQSLSRSRDENLLGDVEAAIRVALQQTAITGSAEPLVATLKQSDERLARYNQPRLEGVRRAIARDLDRVKAVSVTDISSLNIKLDEAVRMVDELPLLAAAEPRRDAGKAASAPAGKAASAVAGGGNLSALAGRANELWTGAGERVWDEVKSLVRVSRIDHPDAMLLAPEQSFFLRENLKLRLLNARLALLSRQFDTAQSDLLVAQSALSRYFDRSSKRTVLATELVKQVTGQARLVNVPRPDDTLAALTAAGVGR